MNSREIILNKLSKIKTSNQKAILKLIKDNEIFCDYPDKISMLDLFSKRFKDLNGELHIVDNIEKAAEQLDSVITKLNENKLLTFSSGLIKNILSCIPNSSKNVDIVDTENISSQNLADYSAGVTTADFLVTRTGSIVLNSLNHGGRRLSVLPPIHVVVAETNQIIASLDEIFNSNLISENWSYATIISGPSRTSDIEKQLVLGAHGPKRLIVILIKNI